MTGSVMSSLLISEWAFSLQNFPGLYPEKEQKLDLLTKPAFNENLPAIFDLINIKEKG